MPILLCRHHGEDNVPLLGWLRLRVDAALADYRYLLVIQALNFWVE